MPGMLAAYEAHTNMTLAAFILPAIDYFLLLPGLSLLNWILRPPHCEIIDFLLFMASLGTLILFAAWGASLVYGVEHL